MDVRSREGATHWDELRGGVMRRNLKERRGSVSSSHVQYVKNSMDSRRGKVSDTSNVGIVGRTTKRNSIIGGKNRD